MWGPKFGGSSEYEKCTIVGVYVFAQYQDTPVREYNLFK